MAQGTLGIKGIFAIAKLVKSLLLGEGTCPQLCTGNGTVLVSVFAIVPQNVYVAFDGALRSGGRERSVQWGEVIAAQSLNIVGAHHVATLGGGGTVQHLDKIRLQVIIPIHKGDVFALCLGQSPVAGGADTAVFLGKHPNAGILTLVLLAF